MKLKISFSLLFISLWALPALSSSKTICAGYLSSINSNLLNSSTPATLAEVQRLGALATPSSPLVLKFKVAASAGSMFNGLKATSGFQSVTGSWSDGLFTATLDHPENLKRALHFLERFQLEITQLQTLNSDQVNVYDLPKKPWVHPSRGSSPSPDHSEALRDTFVSLWPEWALSAAPVPNGEPVEKISDSMAIPVPKSQVKDVKTLVQRMGHAETYLEGIAYLKEFMTAVGLIENLRLLSLIHASDIPPSVILENGLLSSQELKDRGLPHSRWGQNLGDGIYFIGSSGWAIEENTWGKYQYRTSMNRVRLFRSTNRFLVTFIKIYDLYRGKWGLERFGDDSLMVPGLPQSVFSTEGLLARLPWIYEDMNVQGTAGSLEILIKQRRIPPDRLSLQ